MSAAAVALTKIKQHFLPPPSLEVRVILREGPTPLPAVRFSLGFDLVTLGQVSGDGADEGMVRVEAVPSFDLVEPWSKRIPRRSADDHSVETARQGNPAVLNRPNVRQIGPHAISW